MHPGWAAASGLKAALMARNGFLGPRTVFEGEHGFFEAFADPSIKQDLSVLDNWGGHGILTKLPSSLLLVVQWRSHLLIVR